MRRVITGFFVLGLLGAGCQSDAPPSYEQQVLQHRKETNKHFANRDKSPLPEEERAAFAGLNYFSVDSTFRIKAAFSPTPDSEPFAMSTTTERLPMYRKAGILKFTVEEIPYVLAAFASVDRPEDTLLFIPFTDLTSGEDSYGGGRYLDLAPPRQDSIILDFNYAYNPYCAYNYEYSCPLPPEENDIALAVRAGEKVYKHY